MGKSLGIHLTGRIATGVIEHQKPCSRLFHFPEDRDDTDSLLDTPLDGLIDLVREQALRALAIVDLSTLSAWRFRESYATAWWRIHRTWPS